MYSLNGEPVAEYSTNPILAEASLHTDTFMQRLKSGDEPLAVSNCDLYGRW